MTPRPQYEALDNLGYPVMRHARTIDELPILDRRKALDLALEPLSLTLGMCPLRALSYGLPVYRAFGLDNKQTTHHPHSRLLNTAACDISLDLVPWYAKA